jgi:5'-methylthioadenosine phosphorylase
MNQNIPRTSFALISGTAGWGMRFPDDLNEPGVRTLERGLSFETPWGISENWQLIELDGSLTADGKTRQVLNVFGHGWRPERIDHSAQRNVFWVLEQAGVKKVLADSTCGSLNRAVQPRDYLIASDMLYMSQTEFSLLPGRLKYLCRGAQMFCPDMGQTLDQTARQLWPGSNRVYGPANALVVAHTWGPRFETPTEARAFQLLGADFVSQSMCPEATHAREIGACFIGGSYVVNYVDGIVPRQWGELDKIHDEFMYIAPRISLLAIARFELTDRCGCAGFRAVRPDKYSVVGQSGGE